MPEPNLSPAASPSSTLLPERRASDRLEAAVAELLNPAISPDLRRAAAVFATLSGGMADDQRTGRGQKIIGSILAAGRDDALYALFLIRPEGRRHFSKWRKSFPTRPRPV